MATGTKVIQLCIFEHHNDSREHIFRGILIQIIEV